MASPSTIDRAVRALSRAAQARRVPVVARDLARRASVALAAASGETTPEWLRKALFGTPPKPQADSRKYWGRNIGTAEIEAAIVSANRGFMRDLTDLSREAMSVDGHLSSLVTKRIDAIAAFDYEVAAAPADDRPGYHADIAAEYAAVVRQQLACIPNFADRIKDLGWGHWDGRASLEIHWSGPHPGPVRWRVRDLAWIHPRRLSFGPERELRIIDKAASGGFAEDGFRIDTAPFKFITLTPRLFGDYSEREGLSPRCQYWSFFKRFGTRERLVLLELFGKPWRIVEIDASHDPSAEDLDDADKVVDALGGGTTARLPKGMKLMVTQPGRGAGDVHDATIADANAEMSKLVEGQTSTSDAQAAGLGSNQASVHSDVAWLIKASDARRVSAAIEHYLTDAIVALNFGPEALANAPKFRLRAEPPLDRSAEIDRVDKTIRAGVPLRLDEVYEAIGFSKPAEGDTVIAMVEEPSIGGMPGPGPRPQIIYPRGEAPASGEVAPVPATAIARIQRPSEGSASAGQRAPVEDAAGAPTEPPAATLGRGDVCCARQPTTIFGSPDDLVDSALDPAALETERWGRRILAAIPDHREPHPSADGIATRMAIAAGGIDHAAFERLVYERLMQGAMLGALDANREAGIEAETVEAEAVQLAATPPPNETPFAHRSFTEAAEFFAEKQVLSKDVFELLDAAAKKRAFTVARMASSELLKTAHEELLRQLQQGTDLREFRKFAAARLEAAGWTPANKSHVELIFQNNVHGAYSEGRRQEMTQPAVLAARPYWQIRSAHIQSRRRPAHDAVVGKAIRADDPFWQRAPLPWGHRCGCRAISRSERDIERMGIQVLTGDQIQGLPDPGWEPRAGALL